MTKKKPGAKKGRPGSDADRKLLDELKAAEQAQRDAGPVIRAGQNKITEAALRRQAEKGKDN